MSGKDYKFQKDQLELVNAMIWEVGSHSSVKIGAYIERPTGDQSVVIRVQDDDIGLNRDIVSIDAYLIEGGPITFSVLDFKGRQVGPRPVYRSLDEALRAAAAFLLEVIQECKAIKMENDAQARREAEDGLASHKGSHDNGFRGQILSADEVQIVQAFANGIGKVANARGFANFIEAKIGVLSIGLGLLDFQENPILLGTIVAVSKSTGDYECSVRGLDNSVIPGPDVYPTVASALTSSLPYFEYMATRIGRHVRPTFMNRLRRSFGLS